MTKEDIAQRLLKLNSNKPFLTFNGVRKATGLGYLRCRMLVDDLHTVTGPKHGNRTTQLYFVDDVADAIMRKGLGNGEN